MKSPLLYCLIILLVFAACHPSEHKISGGQELSYLREPDDSLRFTHVKDDFYQNSSGDLFERKLVMARPKDSACRCQFVVMYDSLIRISENDTIVEKPLRELIGLASFIRLDSTFYSKDNKHVFYFHGNSDGGTRSFVKGADPATFRRLGDYRWGIDKAHVFYETKMLRELDVSKVRVLYLLDTSDTFVQYVKDDRHVFADGHIVPGADAKTFRMIADSNWHAEDKNRKY